MMFKKLGLMMVSVAVLSSCATVRAIWPWSEEPETEVEQHESPPQRSGEVTPSSQTSSAKRKSSEEWELSHARFWVRLDEMDREILRLKGRIRMLEQGLMLGIIPDHLVEAGELAPPARRSHPESRSPIPINEGSWDQDLPHEASAATLDNQAASGQQPSSSQDQDRAYQDLLAEAQEHFRAGRYGRAIAAFSEIQRRYTAHDMQGSATYWLGLSWFQMKEFHKAKEIFRDFVKDQPNNPWIPRARLYLARCEFQLGFRERALITLRELINAYPNEDAAEMARMEIDRLERAL